MRLVAVGGFGGKNALFPPDYVKFFAEYAPFRLQNLPCQTKKWLFFPLKSTHRNKSMDNWPLLLDWEYKSADWAASLGGHNFSLPAWIFNSNKRTFAPREKPGAI